MFNKTMPSASDSAPQTPATFSQTAVTAPVTGLYQSFVTKDYIADFEVRTDESSGNYFIKLVDKSDRSHVITLFINKGETANVEVPLGNYEMLAATGDTWYGDEYLFGPGTQYSKADCEYPFEMDASGDISGWTVDMTPQVNGNMNMKNISCLYYH